MSFFPKNPSNDLVPIHPDNISNKDRVILLEAGTITGPSPQRIRVAPLDAGKEDRQKTRHVPAHELFHCSRRL